MEITPDLVKAWLDSHEDRDRYWLAEKCGTNKRTVDNWLSSPVGIPAKATLIIERLMREDQEREAEELRQKLPQLSCLALHIDTDILNEWSAAFKASDSKTLEEWAISAIRKAYQEEKSGHPVDLPSNVTAHPSAREKLVSLPFFGLVAAGQPGGPIDVPEGEHEVPGGYDPATHYVLRVNGDSMAPEYPDKTLLLCRKLRDGEFAKKGDDVIACDASGCYFKRLEYRKDGPKGDVPRKARPHLVSLNPDFDEVVPVADSPIVAVVIKKL